MAIKTSSNRTAPTVASKIAPIILLTPRLPRTEPILHRGRRVFKCKACHQAVSEALRLSAISFDAVKMLLLAGLENRPARLRLTVYPCLPAATGGANAPRAYLGLIAGQDSVSLAAGAQA